MTKDPTAAKGAQKVSCAGMEEETLESNFTLGRLNGRGALREGKRLV